MYLLTFLSIIPSLVSIMSDEPNLGMDTMLAAVAVNNLLSVPHHVAVQFIGQDVVEAMGGREDVGVGDQATAALVAPGTVTVVFPERGHPWHLLDVDVVVPFFRKPTSPDRFATICMIEVEIFEAARPS